MRMKLQRCCTDFRGTGVLQLCNECFLGSQGFLKLHFSRTFLMCIQQLFPVEGSHITWRVILPTPLAIKKEPNHCLKERLKISCQEHCVLASKPEQVVSRWRLGYTISPCVCVFVHVCPYKTSRAIPCTITKKLTPVQTERARVCCCICSWRDRTWFFFSSNSDFNPVKPSRALFCDSWPVERSQSSCANHQVIDRTGMDAPKQT